MLLQLLFTLYCRESDGVRGYKDRRTPSFVQWSALLSSSGRHIVHWVGTGATMTLSITTCATDSFCKVWHCQPSIMPCVYVCVSIPVHACVFWCMHVCGCVLAHACVYICVCSGAYMCLFVVWCILFGSGACMHVWPVVHAWLCMSSGACFLYVCVYRKYYLLMSVWH